MSDPPGETGSLGSREARGEIPPVVEWYGTVARGLEALEFLERSRGIFDDRVRGARADDSEEAARSIHSYRFLVATVR